MASAEKKRKADFSLPEWAAKSLECPVCLVTIKDPPIFLCEKGKTVNGPLRVLLSQTPFGGYSIYKIIILMFKYQIVVWQHILFNYTTNCKKLQLDTSLFKYESFHNYWVNGIFGCAFFLYPYIQESIPDMTFSQYLINIPCVLRGIRIYSLRGSVDHPEDMRYKNTRVLCTQIP